MRKLTVKLPSFPIVPLNVPLEARAHERWQVLCGDPAHWRLGYYSPSKTSVDELVELERHDCPELFVVLRGRVSLALVDGGQLNVIELVPEKPVLVAAPHAGFCPDGPHSGVALVVERDEFTTEYRPVAEWLALATP